MRSSMLLLTTVAALVDIGGHQEKPTGLPNLSGQWIVESTDSPSRASANLRPEMRHRSARQNDGSQE